ncbi:hypothetical protein [Bradyrhizobium canariense]|nr:hypothetical protein [Bradyrhizobium canariense]
MNRRRVIGGALSAIAGGIAPAFARSSKPQDPLPLDLADKAGQAPAPYTLTELVGGQLQDPGTGITVPMSWNDSRFASNTPAAETGAGAKFTAGTQANKDWNNNPDYTNGDQSCTWIGDSATSVFTMRKCRVDWREGPRIAGWNGATFNMDQCYINCVGKTGDHADAIQAYAGRSGSVVNFNVSNTFIRAYTDTAAKAKYGNGFIGSTCFFWANYMRGSVSFANVIMRGGQRMFTLNTDTGTTHLSFDRVYFIDDPGLSWEFSNNNSYGGTLIIDRWNEVRKATIVNEQIVPGALIPRPGTGQRN